MVAKAKIAALQAMLEAGQELRELRVTIPGEEEQLLFHYRPLTWLQKSRVLSEATEYRPVTKLVNGQEQVTVTVVLHQDIYNKLALQLMLVDSPIPMTDKVLEGLPADIGAQFDPIIPPPMSTGGALEAKKD